MKIYDTHQEAKIENPDCDIYVLERKTALMCGKFQPMSDAPTDHFCNGWRICKPADYLPSLEWFFDEGHALKSGDLISDRNGNVIEVGKVNVTHRVLDEGYVLRAAALTEKKVITESPEEKEALDMIDTTSKQVESLAKGDVVEWKNGDECIYNGEIYVYQCVASWDSEACILSGKSRNSHSLTDAWIEELSKPESEEQKQIKAMVSDFQKYPGSIFYADMAKYLIDLGWTKEK